MKSEDNIKDDQPSKDDDIMSSANEAMATNADEGDDGITVEA